MNRKRFIILGLAVLLIPAAHVFLSRIREKTDGIEIALRAPSDSAKSLNPNFEALAAHVEEAVVSVRAVHNDAGSFDNLLQDFGNEFGTFRLSVNTHPSSWNDPG